ncbi:class I SAM-dependent methyltransferase [Peribacillus frigoritolerans]|uniref:Class I SAM-dependent methyltransferase n=2 Tax=Peribacillus TaxID=2675229 RepID=A0AA46VEJ9_9BACI|nr:MULTISPECIES: class I SAM-dependent methyltransferase [Peribacillus]MDF1996634.1 class I SAM-dependent methyltransferase [Peribacillus frigoritolerans]MDP1420323.1 class I SAM-dependent methyltransferase [Peribacillus simplex]MDP1453404.1 class I SAM-dependent methyltransferase [Peribacillus frigoritolerans]UYY98284.1 class I SAM-dependent methyltransferase [Peribacillus frigoritolerans]
MIKQNDYWNEVANKKEFTTPFQPELFHPHVNRDAAILDYGCGYGRTLIELRGYDYKNLHGVDFSEEMIKRAKSNDSEIDFQAIQSGKLPFPNHSLDAVLLFAVLTCVYKNEEQNAILNEIKRVLKPEGIIYINDFLLNNDERNKVRYEEGIAKYHTYGVFELPDGAILRHHSEERVKEWTNQFEELEYREVVYTTMNGNRSNGLVYIGKVK